MEWGSWGKLKSFLQQREIKDGIDKLHRDLDAAIMKFNVRRFSAWSYKCSVLTCVGGCRLE